VRCFPSDFVGKMSCIEGHCPPVCTDRWKAKFDHFFPYFMLGLSPTIPLMIGLYSMSKKAKDKSSHLPAS
jgi:hypothetical protein